MWGNVSKKVIKGDEGAKEEDKSDQKVKDQTTNQASKSNQSISRKWSLTLEKSKSISIVEDVKDKKIANKVNIGQRRIGSPVFLAQYY